MKRFEVHSLRSGNKIADGVQFPDGSIAQNILGKVIPSDGMTAALYISSLPVLDFRVDWID